MADDFLVGAPQLNISLIDPPMLMGFVIGEVPGDCRLTIYRLLKKFTS